MKNPITQNFEVEEGDDTAVFFSRMIGGRRVVLIPKHSFTLDETETTYVLTLKQ